MSTSQQQLAYDYPYEIFDKVSYYLTNKQKGICQTVCRSWRTLFTPSQYRHVHVRGRRQFSQFYNTLLLGIVGYYVRRLSVDDVYMTAQELKSLPSLCPNLVALSFNGKSMDASRPLENGANNDNSLEVPFSQWTQLRRLTELQDLTVTNHLLHASNSPLSSLTHLSIRFNQHSSKADFISSLHKATDLISLSLDSLVLSISDMEIIHKVCPNLQKLRLINAELAPIGSTVEEKRAVAALNRYKPAKSMKTFEFQNSRDLYENYEWLYYFASKYVNLVNLELWCAYSVSTPSPETPPTMADLEERYGALARIGMTCQNLKSAKFFNVTMNHWFFEVLDSVGTQLYNIALGDMTDNTIDLLQCLGASKQNVSSLTLWGWSSLCIQETMEETVSMIGQCSDRLSSLTFSMRFSGVKNSPMPFDMLLNRCSKLNHLKLDSIQATLTHSMDMDRDAMVSDNAAFMRPHIRHLALENGSFRNEVFEYLSVRCPNLTKLEIDSCALIGEYARPAMEIKIHMPQHTFESISISHTRPYSQFHHRGQVTYFRLFDVLQLDKKDWHQVYEITEYEKFLASLSFDYEQKPLECTRPTKYICHGNVSNENRPAGPVVSIQCQVLTEFNVGGFWVI